MQVKPGKNYQQSLIQNPQLIARKSQEPLAEERCIGKNLMKLNQNQMFIFLPGRLLHGLYPPIPL